MNKVNMKDLKERVAFGDADRKEIVCVTEDGVVTRRDTASMTVEEARAFVGFKPVEKAKDFEIGR